jgi:hypothetical protein
MVQIVSLPLGLQPQQLHCVQPAQLPSQMRPRLKFGAPLMAGACSESSMLEPARTVLLMRMVNVVISVESGMMSPGEWMADWGIT